MRARTFYTIAILLPAVALAAAIALAGLQEQPQIPLPPGATAGLLYPRFAVRELAAYGLVAAWLLWELRRRTPSDFARLLWRAPLVLVAVSILMLMPFVLVHGGSRELFADNGGRIALRMIVRLAIGYAYLGLAEFVRNGLPQIEPGQTRP